MPRRAALCDAISLKNYCAIVEVQTKVCSVEETLADFRATETGYAIVIVHFTVKLVIVGQLVI